MNKHWNFLFLNNINSPEDLRKYSKKDLPIVCKELRNFIIDIVSKNGGHFASSLGVVELTVALHYVFNTPEDQITWDVGHQAYWHKILTGRKNVFYTNRKKWGLSGFTNPNESEYDTNISWHASVSISNVLWMTTASKLNKNTSKQHIAIIGDGALTWGVAFEWMNNAGFMKEDMLVILNDNQISIDHNIGALKNYLVNISASKAYNKLYTILNSGIKKIDFFGLGIDKFVKRFEHGIKNLLLAENMFFDAMNFRYFGPVDGHDVEYLTHLLEKIKKIPGPKLLHIVTKKWKWYSYAEENQTKWHATAWFNRDTGKTEKVESTSVDVLPKWQYVFGKTMIELAEKNDKLVAVTPAMLSGSWLIEMKKKFPDRVFDVGICEQHAVSFSAWLATNGMTVVCHLYSTFAQRAYDQIIHDVCIGNLPVIFCLDRAWFVGTDGATHQGAYDIAFLRCIPNLTITAPMDVVELRDILYTAQTKNNWPMVIRYPKGKISNIDRNKKFQIISYGKWRTMQIGKELAILSIGSTGHIVRKALDNIKDKSNQPGWYDMRFVKPLDEELLHKIMKDYDNIIIIEDGCKMWWFSSAILERINDNNYDIPVKRLWIPDNFIEHWTISEQQEFCKYDINSLSETIESFFWFTWKNN